MTLLSVLLCSVAPIRAIIPVDTSLATLPVGYFGGSQDSLRGEGNFEMLAKMRLVVIEKWEGPCWNACFANSSQSPPLPCDSNCGEETYQLATLKNAKLRNPNVSAVFYLNTLFDFPFYHLTAEFAAADGHMRDVNGKVIGIENDSGMKHVPIFDFSKQSAIDRYLDFHRNLTGSGLVDGTFPDKDNNYAFQRSNDSTWWICENPDGPPKGGNHTLCDACGQISEGVAKKYNEGRDKVLAGLREIYGLEGSLFKVNVMFFHLKNLMTDPMHFHSQVVAALSAHRYVYVLVQDGRGASTKSHCTEDIVGRFLLSVERGAVLGCNGWSPELGYPLGDPQGPPVQQGVHVTRSFSSGTRVTYDTGSRKASVQWAGHLTPVV